MLSFVVIYAPAKEKHICGVLTKHPKALCDRFDKMSFLEISQDLHSQSEGVDKVIAVDLPNLSSMVKELASAKTALEQRSVGEFEFLKPSLQPTLHLGNHDNVQHKVKGPSLLDFSKNLGHLEGKINKVGPGAKAAVLLSWHTGLCGVRARAAVLACGWERLYGFLGFGRHAGTESTAQRTALTFSVGKAQAWR